MDSARGTNSRPQEPPEQLVDVFKAAALSLTKLYKTSSVRETKALSEGYQTCLEDLLGFLDKENLGLDDGEGWKIRAWITTALNKRDASSQPTESEDETDRNERMASPEAAQTNNSEPQSTTQPIQRQFPSLSEYCNVRLV
ncbi:hypothetical protein CDD81_7736 [Ophiocordyceps australis]|uniref:Uncharacterized protein n=1 Tax=Ophiocordyceps australis TaxID=1399860 RepID=A0A2C5Y4X9_9HYPO|nr:hypothetical protein CDD81_7736 [Ophiocordyceps australis]